MGSSTVAPNLMTLAARHCPCGDHRRGRAGRPAFFVPRLALCRQVVLQTGFSAKIQSTHFHEKWINQRTGHEAEFLTAPESSTLREPRAG